MRYSRPLSALMVMALLVVGLLCFAQTAEAVAPGFGVAASTTSTGAGVSAKIGSTWPWYLTRASGIVAAISLVLLLLSGVGMITGATYRFFEPLQAWAWHRALGIAFGVGVFVHVAVLLFDKFAPFNIFQLLIPFVSKYQPATVFGWHAGSFYIALGIIAFYLVAAIIATSLLWIDKKPRPWKLIHFASYAAVLLVFYHALETGTDFKHGSFRFIWILLGVAVLAGCVMRLLRAGTMRK